MSIQQEIIRIAAGEEGVREAEKNNTGERIVIYQSATWLKPDAWPWCAAFTAWVLKEALHTSEGQSYLRSKNLDLEGWRCRDASAFGWLTWAKNKGLTVFDEHSTKLKPMAGDFIVFDFSHIGIVRADKLPSETVVHTIEGNTNGKGERDSTSGDGVWLKKRDMKLIRGVIRL